MPDTLSRARTYTRLLDTVARIPGTNIRFGLDPIIGLIPGLGDMAGAVLSGYLVMLAGRAGASRTTIVRMLANVAIDTVGGALPILGDAFDVYWKSNSRNLVLLERTMAREPLLGGAAPHRTSRVLIWGSLLVLLAIALAGIAFAYFVVVAIAHAFHWGSTPG